MASGADDKGNFKSFKDLLKSTGGGPRKTEGRKDIGPSPASVGVLDTFNLSHLLYYFASLSCPHIDKDIGFH